MISKHAQIKLCYHYKKVLANENLFAITENFTLFLLYRANLFNFPAILFFQVHTVLFLKSDFSIYFLFFCFNNNIPCFTSFYVYMFQFNFLISLLKSCFFLRFKSSALGIFFENNSICSARFFHLLSLQIYP